MQRTITNPILNDTVTFVRTSAESNGAVTESEATVMPGGGNPPHFHTTYVGTGWKSVCAANIAYRPHGQECNFWQDE